jgi:S-adenosyl-L-methionine hydrolase (adenosine-forming)
MRKRPPGIVTLITDFGWAGEYVGAMKGAILKINPRCLVTDITHQINPQNILQAAHVLQNSYPFYPPGTVHLVVVDPEVGTARRALALKKEGHTFVGPDNGVFNHLLSGGERPEAYEIADRKYSLNPVSPTFHGRDIFAPAAGHLSLGLPPGKLGPRLKTLVRRDFPRPRATEKKLDARILWADSFGNLMTNVGQKDFGRALAARPFQIKGKGWKIMRLSRTYAEEAPGQPMALFGSGGWLEISVNRGNALETLGLKPGESISILWG